MVRIVAPDDWLFRIAKGFLNQIDIQTGRIYPSTFQDKYKDLSFFIATRCSPFDLYQKFSQYKAAQKQCKTTTNPTPSQMYSNGYRIVRIKASIIKAQGYNFKVDQDGNEYTIDGHIDVLNGQQGGITWAKTAIVLDPQESLSIKKGLSF